MVLYFILSLKPSIVCQLPELSAAPTSNQHQLSARIIVNWWATPPVRPKLRPNLEPLKCNPSIPKLIMVNRGNGRFLKLLPAYKAGTTANETKWPP